MTLRRPPIESAREGMRLLADELNRDILRGLAQGGPMSPSALIAWLLVPRSTVGERLDELRTYGIISARGRGRARRWRLTDSGHALFGVHGVIARWFAAHPARSFDETSPLGWRTVTELAATWQSVLLEWIIRASPGKAELAAGFEGFTPRQLREEFERLVGGGLVRLRTTPSGAECYWLTPWGRRGVGVLAAMASWERLHLPERAAPIALDDGVAALLATLPLIRLEADASGLCTFTLEVEPGDSASPRVAAVWAAVRAGRVERLGEGPAPRPAEGWVSGTFGAWLAAIVDGRSSTLRTDGSDRGVRLARGAISELHHRLYLAQPGEPPEARV